jgi:glycosyltransferase involved in cell wall biosynthesis
MDTRSQPLVSVVTPVYNGAEYLAECIDSVLAQTYRNWHYTIVNNCSTDDSLAIARRHAGQDSRIRIHDNSQFLRIIPNLNLSVRQISPASKYCKMVFADDWMFPECLERMVAVAEEHPSVAIVGAYGLRGREIISVGLPYPSTVVPGRVLLRDYYLGGPYLFGTPTSLLFRSDLIRAHVPFFNESNLHADSEKCADLLRSYDFGFVHQILTFHRERPGSLRTFSSRMNTNLPGKLYELSTYGLDFLDKEEFERAWHQKLVEYYRFLAKNFLRGRCNQEFWTYHRKKMAEAGARFSRVRFVSAIVAELADTALNPKGTIGNLARLRKNRLAPQSQENHSSLAGLKRSAE